jgi:hypothetical protein
MRKSLNTAKLVIRRGESWWARLVPRLRHWVIVGLSFLVALRVGKSRKVGVLVKSGGRAYKGAAALQKFMVARLFRN